MNFDGIVGPTHHYGGLSYGNIPSIVNTKSISNPKHAALQGLAKMKLLMDLGIPQGVLPPQERPHLPTLHYLGFKGTDEQIVAKAFQEAPETLFACSSASSMWAANAATVSPSADSQDGRVHVTPANLNEKLHRAIETTTTASLLSQIFNDGRHFVLHAPLPICHTCSDEGAANHTRFCKAFGSQGVQLFTYGRTALGSHHKQPPTHFPARQTYEASQAISRLHALDPDALLFAQQSPEAIDAGVFHNDVISIGHQQLFLYHEKAFVNTQQVIAKLQKTVGAKCHTEICCIPVSQEEVPLEDAVKSYLFNAQIVTRPEEEHGMVLIAPSECHETPSVKAFLQRLMERQDQPIREIVYINLRESMRNGGGPACLRLRVVLTEEELAAIHQPVLLTEELYQRLVSWVNRHYRDRLTPSDLADPSLLHESRSALSDLMGILQLKA